MILGVASNAEILSWRDTSYSVVIKFLLTSLARISLDSSEEKDDELSKCSSGEGCCKERCSNTTAGFIKGGDPNRTGEFSKGGGPNTTEGVSKS